jgi:hypothetical protein
MLLGNGRFRSSRGLHPARRLKPKWHKAMGLSYSTNEFLFFLCLTSLLDYRFGKPMNREKMNS